MIITRTPLRVSFVGGGSDMPSYYEDHEGAVLSCTINKYVYVSVNRKFDHKIRVSYSKTENVLDIHDLEHDIVRAALYYFDIDGGIEITSVSDIPGEGTGLGSSSAFTVGLVNALAAYTGKKLPATEIAAIACDIEMNKCAHVVGKQDQYASAMGGFNVIKFRRHGEVIVRQLPTVGVSEISDNLALLYTGITRRSSVILAHQHCRTNDGSNTTVLGMMVDQVPRMEDAILSHNDRIASILDRAWDLKKQLTPEITTPEIDLLFQSAKNHGAEGGKLLGAGGGGFLLVWRHPKHSDSLPFRTGLQDLPFQFEFSGTQIIYQDN